LSLGIPLHNCENILKYIGGIHSYLRHTILIFNPTNIDEVSVQATHLESIRGKHFVEDESGEPHEFEKHSKENGKRKKTTTMKKDEDNKPTCSHCEKKGHDDKHCWNLHPALKPKWAHPRKG
jgi:hypothetical protein